MDGQSSAEICAPISAVFAAVADLERVAEWQPNVAVAECLLRDAAGHPSRMRTVLDTPIRRTEAILCVSCKDPTSVTWFLEDGDVAGFDGGWTLTQLGDELTLAEYAVTIDFGRALGMFIRGPARAIGAAAVSSMPGRLKRYVEDLALETPPPRKPNSSRLAA